MSNRGFSDDASALLYLVPFAASAIYALFLWVVGGVSAYLPSSVYLAVTRDPIIFAIGSVSVMLGVALEVSSTEPGGRAARVTSVGNTMQTIALASLILSFLSALYANGFSDVSGAVTDFIVGRYSIVFPAMMILLSFLVTAQFRFTSVTNPKFLGVISMLLVPATLYGLGKRNGPLALGLSLLFVLAGIVLFLISARKRPDSEKPSGAN